MENAKIKCIIEAILFVAGEPVCVEDLAHALDLTVGELSEHLNALRDEYDLDARGIRLAGCCSPSKSRRCLRQPWRPCPSSPTASRSPRPRSRRCAA